MYCLISPQRGVVVLEADVLVVSQGAVLRQISCDLDFATGEVCVSGADWPLRRLEWVLSGQCTPFFGKDSPLHQDVCA